MKYYLKMFVEFNQNVEEDSLLFWWIQNDDCSILKLWIDWDTFCVDKSAG